jgi:chlorite dismutase
MDRIQGFGGGDEGQWKVESLRAVKGEGLAPVACLSLSGPGAAFPEGARWLLRGVVSNERYVTREERDGLRQVQEGLGRPEAACAALIPIRKNPAWWELAQDERRAILEDQSRHIRIGLKYLPAVARRLYHCRDLGEPFDFLTWFEFSPSDAPAFEELVGILRATEEWRYVDREVDLRLARLRMPF